MEKYTVVKNILDDICVKMDLKSYTIHSNKNGTVFTLRFQDGQAGQGDIHRDNTNPQEHTTFTLNQRSEYQMNRNRVRASLHQFRYQPRELNSEIEIPRNCDNVAISETSPDHGLDFSPVCRLDANASVFHMSGDADHSCESEDTPSTHQLEDNNIVSETPEINTEPAEALLTEEIQIEQSPEQSASSDACCDVDDTKEPNVKPPVDNIELDYILPRDTELTDDTSEHDFLCEICSALPPARTKLNLCVECNLFICGVCEHLPSHCKHSLARNKEKDHAINTEPPDQHSNKPDAPPALPRKQPKSNPRQSLHQEAERMKIVSFNELSLARVGRFFTPHSIATKFKPKISK